MREIVRNNQIYYSYKAHKMSEGVLLSIVLFAIAVIFLIISILVSYLYLGEAPSFIAGLGLTSIIFNIASITKIVMEIYLYENYSPEIRTMLILQLLLFSVWIFIIF